MGSWPVIILAVGLAIAVGAVVVEAIRALRDQYNARD